MELTDTVQFPDSVHGLDISFLTTSETILWSRQSPFLPSNVAVFHLCTSYTVTERY